MITTLRSKIVQQQARNISRGRKVIEYFFQGKNDAVVKKMHNMQFKAGGWLEGTNQWGLVWRQTKGNPSQLKSDLKCSAG